MLLSLAIGLVLGYWCENFASLVTKKVEVRYSEKRV